MRVVRCGGNTRHTVQVRGNVDTPSLRCRKCLGKGEQTGSERLNARLGELRTSNQTFDRRRNLDANTVSKNHRLNTPAVQERQRHTLVCRARRIDLRALWHDQRFSEYRGL